MLQDRGTYRKAGIGVVNFPAETNREFQIRSVDIRSLCRTRCRFDSTRTAGKGDRLG